MRPNHLLTHGYTPTCNQIVKAVADVLHPSVPPDDGAADAPIRLLDPCAGTGAALAGLAGALQGKAKVKTYGVEIEAGRARAASEVLTHVVRGDCGNVACTNYSMSLVLINPPYDNTKYDDGDSLERRITRWGINRLGAGGIAVFVVPERLLGWLGQYGFDWLALRESPDLKSPSQVVLIGRRRHTTEKQDLPPLLPFDTPLPAIEVPGMPEEPRFYKHRLRDEDYEAAFEVQSVTPADLVRHHLGDSDRIHVLHPLRPGHRAAVLASYGRTINLENGLDIRATVTVKEVTTRTEEPDEIVVRHKHIPSVTFNVLGPEGLEEKEMSDIVEYAELIDEQLKIDAWVEEDEDGYPVTTEAEQAVLDLVAERLPPLEKNREPGLLPAQATRAVGMARYLAAGNKNVLGVMEMGYGKTPISLTVRHMVRELVGGDRPVGFTVILCPPHLTKKWVREAKMLCPDAHIVLPDGNGVERMRQVQQAIAAGARGRDVILILSRSMAKYGPYKDVVMVPKFFGEWGWRWACPECHKPAYSSRGAVEENRPVRMLLSDEYTFFAPVPKRSRAAVSRMIDRLGQKITVLRSRIEAATSERERGELKHEKARLEHRRRALTQSLHAGEEPPERFRDKACQECGAPFTGYRSNPRRWPLADAIYRAARRGRIRSLFLITDEVHEYRNASLQGTSFSRLLRVARYAVGLTGTLFGGKAGQLYRTLRWISPKLRRMGITKSQFSKRYGFYEEVERIDKAQKAYGRAGTRTQLKERPGVSPAVYRFLIGCTAFGSMSDVADALPGYREGQEIVEGFPNLDGLSALKPAAAGSIYYEYGLGGLSVWLQAALGYRNAAPTVPDTDSGLHEYSFVQRDADGEVVQCQQVLSLPPLPPDERTPKEERLIEIALKHWKAGRKTLVLVQQTTTRPVAKRLERLLGEAGLRAVHLDPNRVSASQREEWIEKNGSRIDVLIAHPRSVETGLDLIMFGTVLLYEPVYNIISLQQAIRRVWRLGQKSTVVVKALVYPGMEEFAWKVIARGISWAMSVYGDFTASSLGQMQDRSLDLLAALTEHLRGDDEIEIGRTSGSEDALLPNLAGVAADRVVIDGEATVLDVDEGTSNDEVAAGDDAGAVSVSTNGSKGKKPAGIPVPPAYRDLPLFAAISVKNGKNGAGDDVEVQPRSSSLNVPRGAAEELVQLSMFEFDTTYTA